MSGGLEDFSLFDLFRMEAEEQVRVLQDGLILLESGAATAATLESLMRAAHSIKGAARIVGLDAIVHLTHAVEDRFVAAQHGSALSSAEIDKMLTATDWLARLQSVPEDETAAWFAANELAIEGFTATFASHETPGLPPQLMKPIEMGHPSPGVPLQTTGHPSPGVSPQTTGHPSPGVSPQATGHPPPGVPLQTTGHPPPGVPLQTTGHPPPGAPSQTVPSFEVGGETAAEPEPEDDIFAPIRVGEPQRRARHVRIAADRFDQILALASQTLVTSRNLTLQAEELERTRRGIVKALQLLDDPETTAAARAAALKEVNFQAGLLGGNLEEFDVTSRTNERAAESMYRTVLAGRLRPFSDGIQAASRLVRDTARDLGKQVWLEIVGEDTRVDRDILEKLEAPLSHLITNAVDHGIETPAERLAVGKPAEARLRLYARHENGRLVVSVRDDGRGIYPETLRKRVVDRNLVSAETAAGLSESELLEFLFLPGFSTRNEVNAVSGRGVGLNVVQSMVQEAGGSVVVQSDPGHGTVFRMTLPVTRSVIKVIRVQVEGELYAVPLVRIDRVAHLDVAPLEDLDAPTFTPLEPTVQFAGRDLPVVQLAALLGLANRELPSGEIPLLLCSGLGGGVAFAVDRLVDEVELPVRRLDPRLGKVPGVSAASLDENGLPVLILDIDDLLQTALGRPSLSGYSEGEHSAPHILVVDDSHTVREMERRLLVRAGYQVTTAQNGQEAWNLLRLNDYDLLISDVDMPQMNGIELVAKVRDNPRLGRMPVIILSYKDRDEDRQRGLDAGADFYLTKGDFQNENFRQAVVDLIGPAEGVD